MNVWFHIPRRLIKFLESRAVSMGRRNSSSKSAWRYLETQSLTVRPYRAPIAYGRKTGAPSRARTPQSARRLAGLFGLKRMRDSSLLLSGLQVEPGPVARNDSLGLRLRQRQTQGQRPGRHQRPKATATARHIDYEQRRARSDTARTEKGEMNELRANGERFVCRSNTQFQRVRPGPALRE